VGFKPTFGLVSKHGASQLSWTLDHVGPMARNVQDCAIMLDNIAGYDAGDYYSIVSETDATYQPTEISLDGLRLGVMRRYFFEGDAEVVKAVDKALAELTKKGVVIVDLDIPDLDEAYDAALKTFAEVATVYGDDLTTHPEKFSDDLRKKIEWSIKVSAREYLDAQAFRMAFTSRMESLLETCDAFVAPTSTRPALPIENRPPDPEGFGIRNCIIFNFTGQPSISIPCGITETGLPVGLMLSGRKHCDRNVISIANACENIL
jgi:aspartyl-tRNA(Asn)/glutamyl-tRNA(Gln) amidotransferase subunit A